MFDYLYLSVVGLCREFSICFQCPMCLRDIEGARTPVNWSRGNGWGREGRVPAGTKILYIILGHRVRVLFYVQRMMEEERERELHIDFVSIRPRTCCAGEEILWTDERQLFMRIRVILINRKEKT